MNINKNILTILFIIIISTAANTKAEQKYGNLCIAPVQTPDKNSKACEANPDWCSEKHEITIQVDDGTILPVPSGVNKKYDPIKTGEPHLLIIRDNGKIIESFRFSFEKYKTENLCLWFKPLYLTWSIWPQQNSNHLCKCE